MEASQVAPISASLPKAHPLLLVAAASVTVLSLAGVASLAGWLPAPGAHGSEPAKLAAAAPQVQAAPPLSIQQTVTLPQAAEKPVAKAAERPAPTVRRVAPTRQYENSGIAVSPAPTYTSSTPLPPICRECGVVETVNTVMVEPKGTGGGAVAGGLVGGIIGNQIGKGATRDIATVLGAVGGAYAGNHIEKSTKESKRYDVVARFEDGSTRTFSSDTPPAWQSGDRVRLQNGTLTMGGGRSGGAFGAI